MNGDIALLEDGSPPKNQIKPPFDAKEPEAKEVLRLWDKGETCSYSYKACAIPPSQWPSALAFVVRDVAEEWASNSGGKPCDILKHIQETLNENINKELAELIDENWSVN